VVEHREGEGLQQHALGERRAHGEHRRAGEVQVAFGVALDVTGEPEVGQPVEQPLVGDALLAQSGQFGVPEPEVGQGFQQAAGAGQHAEAPAVRQAPGEDLEDAVAAGGAVGQGGADHGQLVPVGEQGGSRWGRQPQIRRHDRQA
jgi:hypothetical protein